MTQNGHMAKPFVVAREQIPAVFSGQDAGVNTRPFVAHELMARMAAPGAELSWLEARAGQEVATRSHAEPTLLIVMRGRATLVGGMEREIEQGDVLTMPRHMKYGFTSVVSDLHVLCVAIRDEAEHKAEAYTLDRLLEQNRARARRALETPFYRMLRDGSLDTQLKRSVACEAIRVFSDAFQTFLFTRQATCRDASYFAVFHGHLLEELGHNDLLKVEGNERIINDPILRATSTWFSHQMLALDNAGKAVVNLVLETSGYYFHTLAKPVFSSENSSTYFDAHAEADEEHMDLGVELLENQHPDVYQRLLDILDDGWDMMETVTTRFAELIEMESKRANLELQ